MSLVSLNSATQTSPPCDSIGVWLDELPEDVCCRIAVFLDAMHENVVPLAEVSLTQRIAVKRGLDYEIDSYATETGAQERIAHLLREDARTIVTQGFPDYMQVCLRSPKLEELHLYGVRQYELDNILVVSNLRVLMLAFTDHQIPFPFPSGLSHLPIRELSIISHEVCLHETLTDDPTRHQLLAKCFPRVETIFLQCSPCLSFPSAWLRSSYLWRALEPFPCLKEVTLTEPLPKDADEKLKQVNRVKVQTTSAAVAFQLVDKLYDRIDLVRVSLFEVELIGLADVDLIMQDQLERFNVCPNLKSLHCSIQRGTERELAKVTKNLRHLWLGVKDDENGEHDIETGVPLYEPEAGAILDAVRAAPYLNEITLNNMGLRMSEVRKILVETGKRLKMFMEDVPERLTIRGSFQYPVGRTRQVLQELSATFATAALHNPSLKLFYLAPEWHWFPEREIVKESLPRLTTVLTVLCRRVPLLHTYALDRWHHKLRCFAGCHGICLSEIDTSNESDSHCSGTNSFSLDGSEDIFEVDNDSDDEVENEIPQPVSEEEEEEEEQSQ